MAKWQHLRIRIGSVFTLLALLTAVLSPTPALAATECTGDLTGVTIQGNLTVPDGAECELTGSTVTGNVTVGDYAAFDSNGSTIQGKFSGDGVNAVVLGSGTVVKGSVTVSGASITFYAVNSRVNGNLTVTSGFLSVIDSTIGGNLTASGNSSGIGLSFILDNTVGGNLSCDGMTHGVSGSGNVVSGRMTGQCDGF
jgi:hypothetical protein